jgi:hypothetical protein
MRHSQAQSSRGSVLLVALCFVTVLGISLASYVAVCSRSMQISNRTAQTGLSRQLAEMGLEEALRAFNKNDWSDWSNGPAVDWTVSGTTATANLTFPAGTFGQGVTGSVKIRVDNYNAHQLNSTWSSSAIYRIGDLVGRSGVWYRSLRNGNTNQTPSTANLTWWAHTPIPWSWRSSAPYSQYDLVNQNGIWYRCLSTHTSHATTFSSDSYAWTPIPTQRTWSSSTAYAVHDVVAYTDPTTSDITLYRCTTAHTSSASISTDLANWSTNVRTLSLSWSTGVIHTRGSIVFHSGTWYYCRQSGTSSTAPNLDSAMWARFIDSNDEVAPVGDTLVNPTNYFVGDYAYYSGAWYRCTTAHAYSGTWIAGNWTSTNAKPNLSWAYRISLDIPYSFNSVVYWSSSGAGTWWRSLGSGSWENPSPNIMHSWVSSYQYNLGDSVYYSTNGRWYRCLVAHTSSGSILPTNTAYWATDPTYSTSWDSGRQYSQYDTVRYNGVWYLSLQNSNVGQNPATANSYWVGANTTTASYQWSPATAYASGDYKCYGGVWYRCIAATTANAGHNPNNTTYWTASWANAWGVTTGAPVVYAEGTVNIAGNPSIRTQLRAPLTPASLFPNAVAANSSTITANSGGTVDSYDSITGTLALQTGVASTAGTSNAIYGTYASQVNSTTNYSAVVASAYSAGTAITLSSTAVKGYVAAPSSSSAPYAPLISSGGTVKGYSSPGSPNIDLSRLSRSPYIPKFDTIPGGAGGLATNWSTTPKGTALTLAYTLNIGTPGAITPSRYYYSSGLTVGTASLNVLRINGPVILYINGNLNITSSGSTGRIDIASTGSAEIHVTGRFMADAGGQGIQNFTGDPKSLIIISDTTSTSTHYYSEGPNDLYGCIYIPYSTSTTGYFNDNNNTEVFGAISANKITYSGANMNVHYDTSLRYATFGGVDQPHAVVEWRELTDPAERATMP